MENIGNDNLEKLSEHEKFLEFKESIKDKLKVLEENEVSGEILNKAILFLYTAEKLSLNHSDPLYEEKKEYLEGEYKKVESVSMLLELLRKNFKIILSKNGAKSPNLPIITELPHGGVKIDSEILTKLLLKHSYRDILKILERDRDQGTGGFFNFYKKLINSSSASVHAESARAFLDMNRAPTEEPSGDGMVKDKTMFGKLLYPNKFSSEEQAILIEKYARPYFTDFFSKLKKYKPNALIFAHSMPATPTSSLSAIAGGIARPLINIGNGNGHALGVPQDALDFIQNHANKKLEIFLEKRLSADPQYFERLEEGYYSQELSSYSGIYTNIQRPVIDSSEVVKQHDPYTGGVSMDRVFSVKHEYFKNTNFEELKIPPSLLVEINRIALRDSELAQLMQEIILDIGHLLSSNLYK